MNSLTLYLQHQDWLRGIAYRMTGSAVDADDILQEAYLKWSKVNIASIQNPKSYLASIVTRLCIDSCRRQKQKKETYIGPWLPEPFIEYHKTEEEYDNSLQMAFMILLENLAPVPRAVFILREIFDFEYSEISPILKKTPENCRQIFKRAKFDLRKWENDRREPVQDFQKKQPFLHTQNARTSNAKSNKYVKEKKLFQKFILACSNNDPSELIQLFQEEIVLLADGGGKVNAARVPIQGRKKVASFLVQLQKNLKPNIRIFIGKANGVPALLGYKETIVQFALIVSSANNHISGVYSILNPDKLHEFSNFDELREKGIIQSPFQFFNSYFIFKYLFWTIKRKLFLILKNI